MEKILKEIVDKRKITLKRKGINFGINIPKKRNVPISLPDFDKGVLICEIKRGSPSEGKMNQIKSTEEWAKKYIESGANAISVLTEEDFFFGSLQDLIDIKNKFPNTPILRKDFLLSEKEVEISYNAGADLILLITSVLIDIDEKKSVDLLNKMKKRAEELGMLPLIEVHNQYELEKILPLNPKLIGINSRDLKTFKINRGYPFGLKQLISDSTYVVFESGIRNKTDAFFIGSGGFNSVLIGTSIIKSGDIKDKILDIKNGFINGINNRSSFYNRLFYKIFIEKKVVVKICGITNIEDAECAINNGADIIGFIFAKSPRQIKASKARDIASKLDKDILKVAVVVDEFINEAVKAVKNGWVDAIQFQGDIEDNITGNLNICWYKVIRVKDKIDFNQNYFSPILLYDTFSKEVYGGTGKRIDDNLLEYAKSKNIDLYLAGGINPDNVKSIISKYRKRIGFTVDTKLFSL